MSRNIILALTYHSHKCLDIINNSSQCPKSCYDRRSVGQSILVSSAHLGPKTRFLMLSDSCGFRDVGHLLWGEGVCRLQLLMALASAVILGSEFRDTNGHILLSQIRDSPNLKGQVPIFITTRNKEAQLYPQALCFLFVASYDSQGYGRGIWTRLHTGDSKNNSNQSHKSMLIYDWRFTADQFVLVSSPLRLTTRVLFSTEPLPS
jgi:hypothetical protein